MAQDKSGIEPAQPAFRNGALYSSGFGDIYHSVDGAIDEARHVFLDGNRLAQRWSDHGHFTIVETGFGCGLNFLTTWNALREGGARCRLEFVSVEKHPFARDDLAQILAAWPQLDALAEQLLAAYPPLMQGFHRLCFDDGGICLTLLLGDAATMLGELEARANAFYLDGFAPARNPDMWSDDLFQQVRRIAAPGATAATFSSASLVRVGLERAGFVTRKAPGFGRKRDMLTAQLPSPPSTAKAKRKAIVVGAGIAGACSAFALARKGFEVELIDRESTAASGSSFNPAAVVRPFLSLDSGVRNRFGIAAFLYAVRLYRELALRTPCGWHETGVLQLAKDPAHWDKLLRAVSMVALPPDSARLVDAKEADELCGAPINEEGLWFAEAGFVEGRKLCDALIASSQPRVTFRGGIEAGAIQNNGETVNVLGEGGRILASGDVVVLANGIAARSLFFGGASWLRGIRGQVTGIAPTALSLCAPVCRDGYVTPVLGSQHFVGATFDKSNKPPLVTDEDQVANLARAARILPSLFGSGNGVAQSGWAGVRCASRDRLPVIGEVGANLACCIAMGSRGFSWAPLAAEAVASLVAGTPVPLERSVLQRLSAKRFGLDPKAED